MRGNFGYCGPDCPEEDDGKEFDEEVPPLSTNLSKLSQTENPTSAK